jgi:hypothetical protein
MNATVIAMIKETANRPGPSETTKKIAEKYFADLARQLRQVPTKQD